MVCTESSTYWQQASSLLHHHKYRVWSFQACYKCPVIVIVKMGDDHVVVVVVDLINVGFTEVVPTIVMTMVNWSVYIVFLFAIVLVHSFL